MTSHAERIDVAGRKAFAAFVLGLTAVILLEIWNYTVLAPEWGNLGRWIRNFLIFCGASIHVAIFGGRSRVRYRRHRTAHPSTLRFTHWALWLYSFAAIALVSFGIVLFNS